MDFTRQPIIETVITPKEGCKIVVRSSKGIGQEEYFVDALEIVSFGSALFYRSMERPKGFLVPVSDYEVIEVRETRMVLKHVAPERPSIKIGSGRESAPKPQREREREHPKPEPKQELKSEPVDSDEESQEGEGGQADSRAADGSRLEKKRERRRQQRRRRGRDERDVTAPKEGEEGSQEITQKSSEPRLETITPPPLVARRRPIENNPGEEGTTSILTTLLPPPPMLISETIARYRDNDMFKGAFFSKEEREAKLKEDRQNQGQSEERQKDEESSEGSSRAPVKAWSSETILGFVEKKTVSPLSDEFEESDLDISVPHHITVDEQEDPDGNR